MEMKKMMIVGFLVIAAFALPALATFEKDFITPKGVKMAFGEAFLNFDEKVINALTGKILISNPILEEALIMHSNSNALGGLVSCGQSCFRTPCVALTTCSCKFHVCYKNSLAI